MKPLNTNGHEQNNACIEKEHGLESTSTQKVKHAGFGVCSSRGPTEQQAQ